MIRLSKNIALCFLTGSFAVLSAISCDDKIPNCISTPEAWADPYENPIWHPGGQLIGFNHTPLKEQVLKVIPGCPNEISYLYDFDSAGFWTIHSNGTSMRRILPYYLLLPSWSPDGNWIAYVKGSQIFKAPFNGDEIDVSAEVQLTSEGQNFFPTWSQDGQWIAFDSNVDSPTGLHFVWRMRQDGSEKSRLAYTPALGETRMPSWGASQIVHLGYAGNPNPEVFIMGTDGANPLQLTNKQQHANHPSFSPLTNTIGFIGTSMTSGYPSLWFCDSATQNLTEFQKEVRDFSWSNTGQIVYVRYSSNRIDTQFGTLWTINADGSNLFQLTKNNIEVKFID